MKQSVIESFLNLPGMLGLAVLDKYSCSCVCGTHRLQNLKQADAAIQGIQQIVSTTPADLEAFDFWFSHENVRIYKLTNEFILLVLTTKELDVQRYQTAIAEVQQALQTDTQNTLGLLQTLSDRQVSDTNGAQSRQPFPPAPGWQPPAAPEFLADKNPTVSAAPSIKSAPPLPPILKNDLRLESWYRCSEYTHRRDCKILRPNRYSQCLASDAP